MQHKIMPRLTTVLKGTHGFRKIFLSTQRGHEALKMNRKKVCFIQGCMKGKHERLARWNVLLGFHPFKHFHCCNRIFVENLQYFILL